MAARKTTINLIYPVMIKTDTISAAGAYVAPVCKSFECMPEGVICVSGNGSIDDGNVVTWGNDDDLANILPGITGVDNSLLY